MTTTIHRPVSVGRRFAAAALVAGAVLNQVAAVLATAFNRGDTTASGYGAALGERGMLGVLSALANVAGIPLMLLGLVGLLQYCAQRAPIAARVGIVASTIGFLGFLAMSAGLAALYDLGRSLEPAARAPVLAALAGEAGGVAFVVFLFSFLVGSVVGMVATAIALWRSHSVPRWLPIALLVFLIADFVVPSLGWFDAHVVFVVFAVGAAFAIFRTPERDWYGA